MNFNNEILLVIFFAYPLITIAAFLFGFMVGRRSNDYHIELSEPATYEVKTEVRNENLEHPIDPEKIYEEIARSFNK